MIKATINVTGRIKDQAQEFVSVGQVEVLHLVLSITNSTRVSAYLGRTCSFDVVSRGTLLSTVHSIQRRMMMIKLRTRKGRPEFSR